jgi:hypothetical protein
MDELDLPCVLYSRSDFCLQTQFDQLFPFFQQAAADSEIVGKWGERNPNMSLPITMWFQYTFDGKGHIDPAFGEATIGGKPSGLIQASGTYSIDPATGMGKGSIHLPASVGGGTLNRRLSLSNDNTQLHWVSVDLGFQFKGTMHKQ